MGAPGASIPTGNTTLGEKVDYPMCLDCQQHETGTNLPVLITESEYLDFQAFVLYVILKKIVGKVKTNGEFLTPQA